MIAYHYTSLSKWKQIKKQGLKPQVIRNIKILNKNLVFYGTFVFTRKQNLKSNFGCLLHVVSTHNESDVVLLKIKYSEEDLLRFRGRKIRMIHEGFVGNFLYHKEEEVVILQNTIKPDKIELVKHFDLIKISSYSPIR